MELSKITKCIEILGKWGRTCLHCGSPFPRDSMFCNQCEDNLWSRQIGEHFFVADTQIIGRSLFLWQPDQDRPVSMLMTTLKRGRPLSAYLYYAKMFVLKNSLNRPADSVLVPCASARGRRHALVFAQCLGEVLDIPVMDVLRWKGIHKRQKAKSKGHRKAIEFTPTEVLSGRHVIFIDDILTTGATANAARKALQGCVGFEAWCLARRGLSQKQ